MKKIIAVGVGVGGNFCAANLKGAIVVFIFIALPLHQFLKARGNAQFTVTRITQYT
jgi:hypothetical protein